MKTIQNLKRLTTAGNPDEEDYVFFFSVKQDFLETSRIFDLRVQLCGSLGLTHRPFKMRSLVWNTLCQSLFTSSHSTSSLYSG
ncbi:hypothetical protein E2C01_033024 [Portunus trituberculatus]|uniref:Uncharacterized protein n=1 Tax=Portunus trituberculatus TaxID=210409 RepID=A0A5B7F2A8_PORTR|nr:hypothetical protein [Portunus trituberculatus]